MPKKWLISLDFGALMTSFRAFYCLLFQINLFKYKPLAEFVRSKKLFTYIMYSNSYGIS